MQDGNGPWQHFNAQSKPSYPGWSYPTIGRSDWPSANELGFVDEDAPSPQVTVLEGLARRYDVLDIVTASAVSTPGSGGTVACVPPNLDAAAARLYRAVEAGVRTSDCESAASTTSCDVPLASIAADLASKYESSTVFKKYRITPEHARSLVGVVAKQLGQLCASSEHGWWGSFERRAAANLDGSAQFVRLADGTVAYHVDKDARFVARSLKQIEPLFGAIVPPYLPLRVFTYADGGGQEFSAATLSATGSGTVAHRTAGAVAALAAVREVLIRSMKDSTAPGPGRAFLVHFPVIMNAIDSAIGSEGVAVTASMEESSTFSSVTNAVQRKYAPLAPIWDIHVTVPQSDPWWTTTGGYQLFAIPMQADAATAALFPNSKIFQDPTGPITLASLLARSNVEVSALTTAPIVTPAIGRPLNTFTFSMHFLLNPSSTTNPYEFTLVAYNQARREYRLVAGSVRPSPSKANYYSFGGSLNELAEEALAVRPTNPARPKFDGFGFETDWVPPSDALVLGGVPGESALTIYLRRAKESAQEATNAVQSAFDNLLQEKQDDATLSAAVNKSSQVLKVENKSLCGDGNPTCKTDMVSTAVAVDKTALQTGCDDTTDKTARRTLDCATVKLLQTLETTVLLAKPVSDRKDDGTQPSFSDYAGGSLQQVFIDQWAAYRETKNAATEVINADNAAKARVDVAEERLKAATAKIKSNCHQGRWRSRFLLAQRCQAGSRAAYLLRTAPARSSPRCRNAMS